MKTESKIIIFLAIGLTFILALGLSVQHDLTKSKNKTVKSEIVLEGKNNIKSKEDEGKIQEKNNEGDNSTQSEPSSTPTPSPTPTPDPIVYDGLTMDQLSAKLDRSLSSDLAGTGRTFATKSLELGIDPYLAVAIVLHETGCNWDCSYLVKACNNVGGMKGSPGCNGGSYAAFATLDEGIQSYLNNLYRNYYAYGLTTPETIGPKYAASTAWPGKINWYINSIRAK